VQTTLHIVLALTFWAVAPGGQVEAQSRQPAHARSSADQAPLKLSKTGLVRAINGLLVANERYLRDRVEIDGGLFKPRGRNQQREDLQLNPQAKLRCFDSLKKMDQEVSKFYSKPRPCAERFFGDHDVAVARVRITNSPEVEVINTHPASYGNLGPPSPGGHLEIVLLALAPARRPSRGHR
jgi:hypothetical protein